MYDDRLFAETGGLMSYGTLIENLDRRAATYVDKILKGAKLTNLPAERPTKFNLIINLKTAKALGLQFRRPCCIGRLKCSYMICRARLN